MSAAASLLPGTGSGPVTHPILLHYNGAVGSFSFDFNADYLWNKKMEYSLSDEFESRPLRQTTK